MSSRYKKNVRAVYSLKYHLVWYPKYRRMLNLEVTSDLRQEFPSLRSRLPTLWSHAGSVGHVRQDTVQKYIEKQKNL